MGLLPEDIQIAKTSRMNLKRLAGQIATYWRARMDPRDVPWHIAAKLTDEAQTAAWCLGWLIAEIERLQSYEHFYKELNADTEPQERRVPEEGSV